MKGDTGPYIAINGSEVWVPRTVPYLEARRIAQHANQNGDRLVYLGKVENAELVGFAQDCGCEEVCCGGPITNDGSCTPADECLVPAWKFELKESHGR